MSKIKDIEEKLLKEEGIETMESLVETEILKETNRQDTKEIFEEISRDKEDKEKWKEEQIKRCHIYRDIRGNEYMRILRLRGPIPYLVERKVGDKWESGGTQELNIFPYRLPELMEAVRKDKIIFVTNGEKDTDTLYDLGFIGTTGPYSSKRKWKGDYNKYIKNSNVIVIKEPSKEGEELAHETLNTIVSATKKALILPLTYICQELEIEYNEFTDITEIREVLQDDERLKEVFYDIENNFRKKVN